MNATVTTMTIGQFADLMLRGGSISILLLLIAHLVMRARSGPIITSGLIFCVSGIFEALFNAPQFLLQAGSPRLLLLGMQQIHFISLWWFVLSMFDDRFKWRTPCFMPILIGIPLVAGAALFEGTPAYVFRSGLAVLDAWLLAMILWVAVTDPATDLVDERRAFRRVLSFSVPPFTLFVTLAGLANVAEPVHGLLCQIYSAIYFVMAVGFAFWLTSLKDGLFLHQEPDGEIPVEETELTAADRLELDRVAKAMAGGLYLEPGLTIGSLGDVLRIPEHRLRRLINRGLGYRNFAAFVNDYRVAEAKRRLADPKLAREQIIQHAFSLGYASLAPFNRAFRERVGVSPTEYREAALTSVAAE